MVTIQDTALQNDVFGYSAGLHEHTQQFTISVCMLEWAAMSISSDAHTDSILRLYVHLIVPQHTQHMGC